MSHVSVRTHRVSVRALSREAVLEAWAQKIPSIMVALVVAATCASVLLTLGQAAASRAQMEASLEAAGTRAMTITDVQNRGVITPSTIAMIRSMTGVDSVVAVSQPVDVTNAHVAGGTRVPTWQMDCVECVTASEIPQAFTHPLEGTTPALVTPTSRVSAGLRMPVGAVTSARGSLDANVVGEVTLKPGFENYASGIILPADADTRYVQLQVMADQAARVPVLRGAIADLLGGDNPQSLSIETSTALHRAAEMFSGQFMEAQWTTLLLIVGAGGFFSALVTLMDVLLHRKGMGRRRALGITRTHLCALTTIRMSVPAILGAVVGSGAAWTIALMALGVRVPLDYSLAVVWLATVVACLAAFVPALWASRRDPIAVLRTP